MDINRGTVTIFEGKWQKDRVVPIGDRAVAWIEKYKADVRPTLVNGEDNGHLFLSEDGEPMFNSRVSDMIKR